jgi:hypothetical protein
MAFDSPCLVTWQFRILSHLPFLSIADRSRIRLEKLYVSDRQGTRSIIELRMARITLDLSISFPTKQ